MTRREGQGRGAAGGAILLALVLAAAPASSQPALPTAGAGGFSTSGPDNATGDDNGGVWGAMEHVANSMSARSRLGASIIGPNDSTLALSGFDRLATTVTRIGILFSDRAPEDVMPANIPNFNGWARVSRADGSYLMPPNPQLEVVVYNKYAGIGVDNAGNPNSLAVAMSNGLVNALDTYYGNLGGLQRLGNPPVTGLGTAGGTSVGVNLEIDPLSKDGAVKFAGTGSSDFAATTGSALGTFSQKASGFVYAALMMPGTALTADAVDLHGQPVVPFSTLADAMDFNSPDKQGQQTFARHLFDALAGPDGSMTILRRVAGSAFVQVPGVEPPLPPMVDAYALSPSHNPNVLQQGLPAYYNALCAVMEAKSAIYNKIGPSFIPNRVSAAACPTRQLVRPELINGANLSGLFNLASGMMAASSGSSSSNTHWSGTSGNLGSLTAKIGQPFNAIANVVDGQAASINALSFKPPSVRYDGPPKQQYINLGALAGGSTGATGGVTGCIDSACRRESAGAGVGGTMGRSRFDMNEVLQPPGDPADPSAPPRPNALPTWKMVPNLGTQSSTSPGGLVGLMK